MFSAELPQVPSLYCAASTIHFRGQDLSGTGLGESVYEAERRRDAELAEGKAQVLGPLETFCGIPAEMMQDNGTTWDRIFFPAWAGARLGVDPLKPAEMVKLRNLQNGRDCLLPAAPLFEWPSPLSIAQGVAAGSNPESALRNAILEAVERYASLQWWAGHLSAVAPSLAASDYFAGLQKRWCRKVPRKTGLLDITPSFGLPVFIAWSCGENGRELCFGTACGTDEREALYKALKELFQMEFGLDVINYRRRHGVKLARKERLVLARASRLRRTDCRALLTPVTGARAAERPEGLDHADSIAAQLARFGIELYAVDLQRPDDSHWVVKVLSPRLPIPVLPIPARPGGSTKPTTPREQAGIRAWQKWALY